MNKMVSLAIVAASFLGLSHSADAQKAVKLFNGKDLSNWNFVVDKNAVPADQVFSVENGVIHIKGNPFGYMYTKEKYSDYDPVTIAVMNVLNKRAGIGYTTFEHTAATVPVSAVGYKADLFAGSYESTDIFSKFLNVMGIVLPQPPATPVAPTADGAPTQEQPLPSEVSENAPASPETQNVTK